MALKRLICFLLVAASLPVFAQGIDWYEFKSSRNLFEMKYPSKWSVNEIEQGIYKFSNPLPKESKSVFLIRENYFPADSFKLMQYMESERVNFSGTYLNYFPDQEILFYRKTLFDNGQEYFVFYWIIGKGKVALNCSFTILRQDFEADSSKKEYETAVQIVERIRIY